jgi:hypothetical protein
LVIDEAEPFEIAEERQDYLLVDMLSGQERKRTEKEEIVQRMVQVLAAEYHVPLEAIERDVAVPAQLDGRRRTCPADLVVLEPERPHILGEARRVVVVQPPGTEPTDPSRGLDLLTDLLEMVEPCRFGPWTNGRDVAYLQKIARPIQPEFVEFVEQTSPGDGLRRPAVGVAGKPPAGRQCDHHR